jgi:hypothetical protein
VGTQKLQKSSKNPTKSLKIHKNQPKKRISPQKFKEKHPKNHSINQSLPNPTITNTNQQQNPTHMTLKPYSKKSLLKNKGKDSSRECHNFYSFRKKHERKEKPHF